VNIRFVDVVRCVSQFVRRAPQIVEAIEANLLNVRERDLPRTRDRAPLVETLNTCFGERQLLENLSSAHVRDGFEIVARGEQAHELDTIELVARAYDFWQHHRWPGRNGRLTYARTLYAVHMLRQLEHLTMRIWDDGNERAAEGLREVQQLLDGLNAAAKPAVFVRDARWLIQTAQGSLTRHLAPYFRVAEQISESFTAVERLEVHKAGAKLAGGHLRSQLCYRSRESGQDIDAPDVLMVTRNSNSMDVALLVQDLVPLLEQYEIEENDEERLDLSDAIIQGVSADSELLVERTGLLGPYTIVEELFDTPLGARHRALVGRYRQLVARLGDRLRKDALAFDPSGVVYSPLGIAYGFCADIFANMAATTLVSGHGRDLTLEDVFASRGNLQAAQALACEWQQLPRRAGEGEHFEHSIDRARQMFARAMNALDAQVENVRPARLFVIPESRNVDPPDGAVSAQEHCITSDLQRALATGATAFPKSQILLDRREARFLASADCGGTWFGVSKSVLTAYASRGKDAYIQDIPPAIVDILRATCSGLVEVPS
jgi:hypothetical protein